MMKGFWCLGLLHLHTNVLNVLGSASDERRNLFACLLTCLLRLEARNIGQGNRITLGKGTGKNVDDQSVHDVLSVVFEEDVESLPLGRFDAVLQALFEGSILGNFAELFRNDHVDDFVATKRKLDLEVVVASKHRTREQVPLSYQVAIIPNQIDQVAAVCLHGMKFTLRRTSRQAFLRRFDEESGHPGRTRLRCPTRRHRPASSDIRRC